MGNTLENKLRPPSKRTISRGVYDMMLVVIEQTLEQSLENLTDRYGEKPPRGSLSACVKNVNEKYFPHIKFYTRTNRRLKILLLGMHKDY